MAKCLYYTNYHEMQLHNMPRSSVLVWLLFYAHTHTEAYLGRLVTLYTDTNKPVDGNRAQDIMVTVRSGFRTKDLSITGPTRLITALTGL
jgi:hypothetical protein